MKFDPFPKYSYITKTICSIFRNLGKDFNYAQIKEIAFDSREPTTDDEKLANFLASFLMVSMVNKNKSSLAVFDYFDNLYLRNKKELKIELLYKEKMSRNKVEFASFLLIKAFKYRKNESLFGTLFIMSQNAIFKYCGKYFVYPPCFFTDWKTLLENEQELYLTTIIQTKIDRLENTGFLIPVKQLDSFELKKAFKDLTPQLVELNVNVIKVFGSYANNSYTSQSDIDLLVSLEKNIKRTEREQIQRLIQEKILRSTNKLSDIMFEDLIPPWASDETNSCIVLWEKCNENL